MKSFAVYLNLLMFLYLDCCCSVTKSCMTLRPHGQQASLSSAFSWTFLNSYPPSWWCRLTVSFSVAPFSSCLRSFPASDSFPVHRLFPSHGQIIGASASPSVLPMKTQDWSPLGWIVWISFQSKGLSRVFSNITVQMHQFFSPLAFFMLQLSHQYMIIR